MALRKRLSLANVLQNIESDEESGNEFHSTESLNLQRIPENNHSDEIMASHLMKLFNQVEKLKSNIK